MFRNPFGPLTLAAALALASVGGDRASADTMSDESGEISIEGAALAYPEGQLRALETRSSGVIE